MLKVVAARWHPAAVDLAFHPRQDAQGGFALILAPRIAQHLFAQGEGAGPIAAVFQDPRAALPGGVTQAAAVQLQRQLVLIQSFQVPGQ